MSDVDEQSCVPASVVRKLSDITTDAREDDVEFDLKTTQRADEDERKAKRARGMREGGDERTCVTVRDVANENEREKQGQTPSEVTNKEEATPRSTSNGWRWKRSEEGANEEIDGERTNAKARVGSGKEIPEITGGRGGGATPSRWGDASPGEHGGSQYVMSPGREYSECESEQEFDEPIREALKEHKKPQAASAPKMFPIFCSGRKQVLLVRHGQSTYNEAIAGPGSFDEPQMFDAALTELGRIQAKGLGLELSKVPKDALWITSPLTRAMETCVIGRRAGLEVKASRLKEKAAAAAAAATATGACDENVDSANTPGSSSGTLDVEKAYEEWTRKVVICADLTEKLSCTGDIGRPKRSLERDFPDLALAISRIPADRWWWDCERGPNDAESRQFNSFEPKQHFKQRVERFRSWLLRRPEKTFVVFGHSTFFKEFIGGTRTLKNCEIHTMML